MGFQSDVNSVLSTAALGIGGVKHIKEQKKQGKSLEGIKKSIEEYEKKYPLNEKSVERVSELKDEETGETLAPGYTSVGADFLERPGNDFDDPLFLENMVSNTLKDIQGLTNTEFNAREFLNMTPDNFETYGNAMDRIEFRKNAINARKEARRMNLENLANNNLINNNQALKDDRLTQIKPIVGGK